MVIMGEGTFLAPRVFLETGRDRRDPQEGSLRRKVGVGGRVPVAAAHALPESRAHSHSLPRQRPLPGDTQGRSTQ